MIFMGDVGSGEGWPDGMLAMVTGGEGTGDRGRGGGGLGLGLGTEETGSGRAGEPENGERRMMKELLIAFALGMGLLVCSQRGRAGDDDKAFFEEKILPVLKKHCYECHSSDAKKLESGLKLDTRQGLLRGGEMGVVIVPGKPDESRLLKALRYEKLEMPPAAKLPGDIADDFEEWIRRGANDPREE